MCSPDLTEPSTGSPSMTLLNPIKYDAVRILGKGSFGTVYLALKTDGNTPTSNNSGASCGVPVAIKKIRHNTQMKSREIPILKQLNQQSHPYIINLQHTFTSYDSKNPNDVFLHLVMDYYPDTLFTLMKSYFFPPVSTTNSSSTSSFSGMKDNSFPLILCKIYMYQLLRAMAHIHGMGICHR